MKKLENIIHQLNTSRENITSTLLDKQTKTDIITVIDSVVTDIKEVERLNTYKQEIKNQLIEPVQQEINKGNRIGKFSIIASIGSLILSLYTLFISPQIIKDSQQDILNSTNIVRQNLPYQNANNFTYSENGMFGLLDANKNKISDAVYEMIEPATSGYLKVKQFEKYGIINLEGETQIPIKYKTIQPLVSQDLYRLQNEKRYYGIANLNNKHIIPIEYKYLAYWPDVNLLSYSKEKELYGIMDLEGELIVQPKYGRIVILKDDLFAEVVDENVWDLRSYDGTKISRIQADYINTQQSEFGSFISFGVSNKIGAILSAGKVIVPAKFDYIQKKEHFFDCIKGETSSRYSFDGKCLINCK